MQTNNIENETDSKVPNTMNEKKKKTAKKKWKRRKSVTANIEHNTVPYQSAKKRTNTTQ